MAKKRTMNPFEAHIEKIALAVALIIFVWIIIGIMKPAGVEVGNRQLSPSEAAKQSAQTALEIQDRMRQPIDVEVPAYQPRAELFAQNEPLPPASVDSIPLNPIYLPGGPESQDKRTYIIPAIPELTEPAINFTQAVALVQTHDSDDPDSARTVEQPMDVDFVSLELTFPFGQLRQDFQRNFAGPTVDTPLEQPMPVIAAVQLQRSVLLPNGDWSEYQDVPTLNQGEPQPLELPSIDEVNQLAQSLYELEIENRFIQLNSQQQQIIQPIPYVMQDDPWLPPTQQVELDQQQRDERRRGARQPQTADRRQQQPGRGQQRQQPGRGGQAAPGGMMPGPGGAPGGMMPGGPGAMPGMMQPGGQFGQPAQRTAARSQRSSQLNIDAIDWNLTEEITIWAHDGQVQLGTTYRYRIRIGVFNPVAGHDWLTEAQAGLEEQRILWTQWVEPQNFVQVPERTAFFPRTANLDDNTVSFDVYRNQNGTWYSKTFVVAPGQAIGAVARINPSGERRRTRGDEDEDQELVDVDFRTFATLVDIIPDSNHWIRRGRQLTRRETQDFIYRAADGNIERLPIDNTCWPTELSSNLTRLRRETRGR